MEIVKLQQIAAAVQEATAKGRHVDLSYRRVLEDAKSVEFLDQQNFSVFVQYPGMAGPVWEHYENVGQIEIGASGELRADVKGVDADGDWLTVQIVTWPRGIWLKSDATIEQVPNPFYEAPEVETAEESVGDA